MHIPPYYKKKTWQMFFIGVFVGGIIGYFVLLYMYSSMYEELLEKNYDLREALIDLREQNEVLLKNQEQQVSELTVKEIEIIIENEELLKNDSLLVSKLKTLIKEEISYLIGTDVLIISASEALLLAAIENKAFSIDNVTYRFTVTRLTISQTLKIVVEASLIN